MTAPITEQVVIAEIFHRADAMIIDNRMKEFSESVINKECSNSSVVS